MRSSRGYVIYVSESILAYPVVQISFDLRLLTILSKDWYALTLVLVLRHEVYMAKGIGYIMIYLKVG